MTRESSARLAKIAARRIHDPDEEVAALAGSVLAQFEDQAGGLTPQEPTMNRDVSFTYTGSEPTKYVSGQTFTKGEPKLVTDQGVIGMIRDLYADDFTEGKPQKAPAATTDESQAPDAPVPKPAQPKPKPKPE